jgi:threonine-phosphate decarboxylase
MSDTLFQEKFVHGDDAYRFPGRIKANFSSNIWPGGTPKALQQRLRDAVCTLSSYPPVEGESVRDRLAAKLGVDASMLVLTNGATEAIYLIAQAYANHKSTILVPAFSEYGRACTLFGHHIEYKKYDDFMRQAQLPDALYWICNPNNPTGQIIDPLRLLRLAVLFPQSVFVIDEAYESLVAQECSMMPWIDKVNNIIVLRSLTKSYAVPGARVGYLVAPSEIASRVCRFKPPWSVNALALTVVDYSIDNEPFSSAALEAYLHTASILRTSIGQLDGLEVMESKAGFFLVKVPENAAKIKLQLIEKQGILVRDTSSFGGLDGQFIRVACQNATDNDLLLAALAEMSVCNNYV